ncbi:MAG: hypothetical protein ACI89W_001846 [Gammaproteobacteria bacterium]|jgi:hypothetical protein
MKLKINSIFLILTLTVFTGTVNATMNASTDLVTDKAITMQLIKESFEQYSLVIETTHVENDVRALLVEKPYIPKTRFFARITGTHSMSTVESDE